MSVRSNLGDFAASLDKVARQVPQKANQIKRKVALQVLNGVVLRTPVDTGRAKGNWQATLEAPATVVLDRLDKTGQATIAEGQTVIGQAQPGQDIWITNNLPYIGRLERGHSKQAPAGMVAQTLATVKAQFPG